MKRSSVRSRRSAPVCVVRFVVARQRHGLILLPRTAAAQRCKTGNLNAESRANNEKPKTGKKRCNQRLVCCRDGTIARLPRHVSLTPMFECQDNLVSLDKSHFAFLLRKTRLFVLFPMPDIGSYFAPERNAGTGRTTNKGFARVKKMNVPNPLQAETRRNKAWSG